MGDEETKATSVELVDESQNEVGPVTKEATEVTRSSDLDVDQKDHAAYLDGRGLCAGMSSSDESLPERARNVAKNAKAFATKTRDRPKPLSYVARLSQNSGAENSWDSSQTWRTKSLARRADLLLAVMHETRGQRTTCAVC